MDLWVTSPEDTILAKLRWETDALRVYEVQYSVLNREYLEHWVDIMDLRSEWQRLLEKARPIDA